MIDGFRDYDAWKLDSPFDDYDYDNHEPSEEDKMINEIMEELEYEEMEQ